MFCNSFITLVEFYYTVKLDDCTSVINLLHRFITLLNGFLFSFIPQEIAEMNLKISSSETQGQIVGSGQRFRAKLGARANVYRTHISAPALLHLPRQFKKMPENFEIPVCNWPEKMFFWVTEVAVAIDRFHYDVISAKPDGSCSRLAETGLSGSWKWRESKQNFGLWAMNFHVDIFAKVVGVHASECHSCKWRNTMWSAFRCRMRWYKIVNSLPLFRPDCLYVSSDWIYIYFPFQPIFKLGKEWNSVVRSTGMFSKI